MNMKQLKYIMVLAAERSFSVAAERLKISQPSLSQYVKKIEKQIGVELFERVNGEVRLTSAGESYVEYAKKILDLERQMQSSLIDISNFKAGSVIIGTSPYMAASMMPQIACEFNTLYPGMFIKIREGTTIELMEALEQGEYDMCLTLLPVNDRIFEWEKIYSEEMVLAVPSTFEQLDCIIDNKHHYPTINIKQMDKLPFVKLTESQYMQQQLENIVIDYELEIETAAIVKSLEAQIAMVKAGVGVALVPSGMKRFCDAGGVDFYSFRQELPKRDVVIVWRKEIKPSKVMSELINIAQNITW